MTMPVSTNSARALSESRINVTPSNAVNGEPAATRLNNSHEPKTPLPKLTALARQLVSEGPPYDLARIAQLSQAIASGEYKIDTAAIADAILSRMPLADR